MSHQYTAVCIYCGKDIFIPFYTYERHDFIVAKQKGKYGRNIYAHRQCYKNQTIGVNKLEFRGN